MYNVRQITNLDISDAQIETKGNIDYAVLSNSFLGGNVIKFGYCAKTPRDAGNPIYFTIKGFEKEIKIGKTGMYEVNTEDYYDQSDKEYKTVKPQITEIKVPKDSIFTLDYVIEV